jgi:molybdate transport system permease protein
VFVTHDRDEAYRFCQDLVVLSEGRVAAAGPKREIFQRPESLAVARLTGCKNFAAIVREGHQHIRAPEWACTLRVAEPVPENAAYVGIRAHHLRFEENGPAENSFPCWLMGSVESPFEITLYLRLHAPPQDGDAPHMEAEVSHSAWAELAVQPQPWHVRLDPARLLLLRA